MQNKNTLILTILVTICLVLVIVSISLFQGIKKIELSFNEKKATLVKENLELKDKIDSIQEIMNQKIASVNTIEKEKKELEDQLNQVKKEQEKFAALYTQELNVLKRKNESLKKSVSALGKSPLIKRIKDAMEKEDNENIRKLLQNTLDKIELIKSGKSVNLEPIVVTKKEEKIGTVPASGGPLLGGQSPFFQPEGKEGAIISLDQKNNLMVINLGTKDSLKEGDRCTIIRDGQEIAQAEILSVRYRIAAAFIDDIRYKCTINDIKEGYKVVVVGK